MFPATVLVVLRVAVAGVSALWAALLALGEEAAVGEALHTLGDAPPTTVPSRVPLHRAFHVARLALLVLGAVAAADALAWWQRPWLEGALVFGATALLLFVGGDALPRSAARLAPEFATWALPLARRSLAPFAPLLWVLAWVDRGLHRLVATPRPLQPDLGAAQRDHQVRKVAANAHAINHGVERGSAAVGCVGLKAHALQHPVANRLRAAVALRQMPKLLEGEFLQPV